MTTPIQIQYKDKYYVLRYFPKHTSTLHICHNKGNVWVEYLDVKTEKEYLEKKYLIKKIDSVKCILDFILKHQPSKLFQSIWIQPYKKKVAHIKLYEPSSEKIFKPKPFEIFEQKIIKLRNGQTIMNILKTDNEALYKKMKASKEDISGERIMTDRGMEVFYTFVQQNWI